jgi:redox-sensitive bicupin YhaK (pirin superfamily)
MITIRKAADRGHFDHGWLNTYHTFSFADYYDPRFMGFRDLRVINEDRVAGGMGFGTHGHRDMEIISYVLEGELSHGDSMGTGAVLRRGEVQRMTAGTGVMHSEFNGSKVEPVHFLQIWILPERSGLTPGYEQKEFPESDRRGRWRLLASPDAADGSVKIHQDVRLYSTVLDGSAITHTFAADRYGWIQVARGSATVNGETLVAGDGAAIEKETEVTVSGNDGEVLLFDLN